MLLAATAVATAAAASAVSRPFMPVTISLHHTGTSPVFRSASLPMCPSDGFQADHVLLRATSSRNSAKQAMRSGFVSPRRASVSFSRLSQGGCRMSFTLPADTRLLAAGVGGTLAGSLHAVTGPDHLAVRACGSFAHSLLISHRLFCHLLLCVTLQALLPMSIGQRWWKAIYAGAYWGEIACLLRYSTTP
eukprot:6188921-Pleurochrysis_carterae.AAC.3